MEGAEEDRGVIELSRNVLVALPLEGVGFGSFGLGELGIVSLVLVDGCVARFSGSLESRFSGNEGCIRQAALLRDPTEVAVGLVEGLSGGFALVSLLPLRGKVELELVTLGREDGSEGGVVGGLLEELFTFFEGGVQGGDLGLDGITVGLEGS